MLSFEEFMVRGIGIVRYKKVHILVIIRWSIIGRAVSRQGIDIRVKENSSLLCFLIGKVFHTGMSRL